MNRTVQERASVGAGSPAIAPDKSPLIFRRSSPARAYACELRGLGRTGPERCSICCFRSSRPATSPDRL